jgi:hypothetical protein
VRNAWESNEVEGRFVAFYTAKHVEPHEARVILVTFGEASAAAAGKSAEGSAAAPPSAGPRDALTRTEARRMHADEADEGHGAAGVGGAPDARAARGVHSREAAANNEPPTLATCAAQHADSLVLGSFALIALASLCLLLMSRRLLRRWPAPVWAGAAKGHAAKSPHAKRPHAV